MYQQMQSFNHLQIIVITVVLHRSHTSNWWKSRYFAIYAFFESILSSDVDPSLQSDALFKAEAEVGSLRRVLDGKIPGLLRHKLEQSCIVCFLFWC